MKDKGKRMEEEKLEIIERINRSESYIEIKGIIANIGNEELKVEQLGRLYEWDKLRIIMGLKSETLKTKALDYLEDEINRYKIVLELSDKAKVEQISKRKGTKTRINWIDSNVNKR